jgi:Rps23 Pro-64 3,4-dihydroxylase Tpa1-like proline 4-hydroxylase
MNTFYKLDTDHFKDLAKKNRDKYVTASPFPHIYLDDVFPEDVLNEILQEFPNSKQIDWQTYQNKNEVKLASRDEDSFGPMTRNFIHILNSKPFISFLEELTGIKNLIPDCELEGGGLHQSKRGGFLNIHADFTVHPHKRNWRRRVNVLIYLNENWLPEYEGNLELWTRDMKACAQKVLPIFNRCAIFNTDEDSFHGLPEPIKCPEDMTRKSIALYYFTEETAAPRKRATNYRARPNDGFKSVFIYLDKQMVSWYNTLKGWLGIDDKLVSKVLNFLNGRKK